MRFPKIGPGVLVAAAFIGPGTVTVCISAGATLGYSVTWAIVVATLAAILLQEMAARLGIISGAGLGQALLQMAPGPLAQKAMITLVLSALFVGNAAYEGGNLSGAALGAASALGLGQAYVGVISALVALIAGLLLWFGAYRVIERVLVALVLLMAMAFVATAIIVQPDWLAMFKGLKPEVNASNTALVIALIGTTIVPYNLFLHARSVRETWQQAADLPAVRVDNALSIGLGGVISLLILATAAASFFGTGVAVNGAAEMASLLEPVFGAAARYMLALGLLAAGLTSAITAPLATAYAVCECLPGLQARFKIVALSVVLIGAVLASAGLKPLALILFAQIANGLLLPVIAVALLLAVNSRRLGDYRNKPWQNLAGAAVVLLAIGLGLRLLLRAFGLL